MPKKKPYNKKKSKLDKPKCNIRKAWKKIKKRNEMLKVKKIQNDERQSQVRLEFNEARLPSLEWRVGRRVRYIRGTPYLYNRFGVPFRHAITEGTIIGIVVGHGEQYNVEWDSNAVSRHTSFSRPQLQLLPEANTIVLD